MNSLIGMGATTSFAAGAASAINPALGLEATFMEEPVMLLAFVLLGRALEARARLKASGMGHHRSLQKESVNCLTTWDLVETIVLQACSMMDFAAVVSPLAYTVPPQGWPDVRCRP